MDTDRVRGILVGLACGDALARLVELFAESAEEAIVTAVNRGGDADTIGAIAGAVAGARFGASALPDRWLAVVDEMNELNSLATQISAVE